MTIEELYQEGSNHLRDNGFVHGDRETAEFLRALTNNDTAWIISHGDEQVSDDIVEQFREMVLQRIQGKPLAYIVGTQNFMGWLLKSDERALIPRPETEQLTEELIRLIRKHHLDQGNFLEIGTGSGAIAIALKKHFPMSTVTASDISEDALSLAEENAQRLKVDVTFLESDLFSAVPKQKFDVIVANLPYVPSQKLEFVSDQILDWEPMIAIDAGDDGMKYLTPFLSALPTHLKESGIAAIEMWHTHAEPVKALTKNLSSHQAVVEKDAAGFDRFIYFVPTTDL